MFSSTTSPEASEIEGYQVEDMAPNATLFILPPSNPTQAILSHDIECVKWHVYLALREIPGGVNVRWDLASEGAVDGRLPNLFLPVPKRLAQMEKSGGSSRAQMKGELLGSRRIPSWVDGEIGKLTGEDDDDGILEGYRNEDARDESRAWVALLEGDIHAALKATAPIPSVLTRMSSFQSPNTLEKPILSTTFTGVSSMVPPFGSNAVLEPILGRYKEAMEALSMRLATDRWFLGSRLVHETTLADANPFSRNPTALDAVAFAHLFAALESPDTVIHEEVRKWVNLVAWEKRVRKIVENATSVHGLTV
jgi:metaxin